MKKNTPLSDSAFVVLSIVAEGKTYGYDIIKTIHNRGFRFWTDVRRSSSYNALLILEKNGFVISEIQPGEGPDKKVYKITDSGRKKLVEEATKHLSMPSHPRSEIDLGLYALPFIDSDNARDAIDRSIHHLTERKEFLQERLEWCQKHKLLLPSLSFERPLVALEAEIAWLKKVKTLIKKNAKLSKNEWQSYEYKEPPIFDSEE